MAQSQGNPIDYVNFFSGLSDSDGERRKQAEEVYNAIPAKERFSILGVAICQRDLPEAVRVFAAVLLRRLILTNWLDISSSVPPEQLLFSCNELLNMLRNSLSEPEEVRDKMCQIISVLGKSYLDEETKKNRWAEFTQFLFELFKSPHDILRQCGFNIFNGAPEVLGSINGETAYLDQIVPCLMESFNLKGKTNAFYVSLVAATCSLIVSNSENKDCIRKLSGFAQPLVEILKIVSEPDKESVCQSLIEVAEEAPLLFRPCITPLLQICIEIMAESDESESEVRFSALELAVTLIERAPGMIKKRTPQLIRPIVLRILSFMESVDDDPDWYTSCTNDKDGEEPDTIGESALDRVSNALRGKVLLPILMQELTLMLQKTEWQARHAALMAFSCSGEGCHDQLLRDLGRIVNGILIYLSDPHPRVRYAACNAIGQMATDFSPEFENQFHAQVIPSLCQLLVDTSQIRVQAHSACAMINFFEHCPQEILANYLDSITKHMQAALSNYMSDGLPKDEGRLFVIENIIVALSSVADSSAESFVKYYENFMPCLKFIIKNATGNDDLRVMRGKAIECVSLIGMAVGKEIFCSDASEIMQMLLATQTGDIKLADDDPQLSYMMAAWARICRILGSDFQSYLPYVMEPVLKAAGLRVEIALLSDEDRAAIENSQDWESVSVQDQAVGIRTAGLEDKATACSMLVCYARELKQGFVDYVERTAEVLIPLIKFPFHDDVRCAAMEAMPYLLESAKPKGEPYVLSLSGAIAQNLMEAFDLEADATILNQLMESLASCIEVVGRSSMSPGKFEKLNEKLTERFKEHFTSLEALYEYRKDEDYEPESDCSDEEEDCLSGIASLLHSLFVVYRSDYLNYFTPLIEPIVKLSVDDQVIPWTNRHTALCIWVDLIEYSGAGGVEYQKFYLPLLTNGVVDKNKEIRQAALYGIGQLAQQTGATFLNYFQGIIPNIVQVINHPEARHDDYIMATENGIAAIGRILKYCPQVANHQDLLKCWVDWLPIWEDETEVPFVMEYLLELIEQNNQTVMGPNSSNLPRLVSIVAEVFARSVIASDTEVGSKMVSFLKQIHANPSLNGCLGSLTMPQQQAVQEVLRVWMR